MRISDWSSDVCSSDLVVSGSFTPADPAVYQFVNLDRARGKGAEARFEGRASSGLYTTLALSYAKGNEILPDGPRAPLSTIEPLKPVAGVVYRAPTGRSGGQPLMTPSPRKDQPPP